MNVYQEVIKELKRMQDAGHSTGKGVYTASQVAFDLVELYEQGQTIPELAQYCIKKNTG